MNDYIGYPTKENIRKHCKIKIIKLKKHNYTLIYLSVFLGLTFLTLFVIWIGG